ncbi:40S ribosomal protein S4 [Musa troglodytarum]|uniref:40S ribosomal protein S4 n=1 Tax=Musa troglodytarum TaxID=320322 RepID=A0A9E7HZK5_9LILI|nr:40S ribosomal protein S4 [Musa troglodytarum]
MWETAFPAVDATQKLHCGSDTTFFHDQEEGIMDIALASREDIAIQKQCHVMVDGKVRTDKTFPAGFMDVVSIPKTNENFCLLYDTKGRFCLHSIRDEEAKFKLCKVRSVQFGQNGIPYLNTYDGRTIQYPDPLIKVNDTIKLDLETNKIVGFIKFDVGNVVMLTGRRNTGQGKL